MAVREKSKSDSITVTAKSLRDSHMLVSLGQDAALGCVRGTQGPRQGQGWPALTRARQRCG